MVRKPGFHPGNSSSILDGDATLASIDKLVIVTSLSRRNLWVQFPLEAPTYVVGISAVPAAPTRKRDVRLVYDVPS